MLTLNRKSAVYQHLFNNAMARLNRVPKELLEPLTEPTPKYAATLTPYIFERSELEFSVVRNGSPTDQQLAFGEYFTPRITQNQAVAYDRTNCTWFSMPMEVAFGGEVLASLMWIVFNRRPGRIIPFDLRTAAHRAVMVYAQTAVGVSGITRKMEGKTFFSPRTERLREEFLVVRFLNSNDLSSIDRLIGRQVAQMVEDAPRNELTVMVRLPVQTSHPGTAGYQFDHFPFSYSEYSDAFTEAILDLFLSYACVEAGDNDRDLVASLVAAFGKPEDAVKAVRVACFNRWLTDDAIGPVRAREVVREELSNYRAAFAAVYRVELSSLIEIEL